MNVDKKIAISINENTTVIIFSDGTNNLIALSKEEPSLLFCSVKELTIFFIYYCEINF